MSSPRPELLVAPCSYQAAKYAVEKWHYSGVMPAGKTVKLGVWEDGRYIGAVIFSLGTNKAINSNFDIDGMGACELTRIALNSHNIPVSKIVSLSLSILKRQSPGLRLVVSYADPLHNHNGGIYQAGNWIYIGNENRDKRNRTYKHKRTGRIATWRSMAALLVRSPYSCTVEGAEQMGWEPLDLLNKHKYLYPLDRAMRRQIAPLAQPYPKKDTRPVNGDDLATSEAGRFDSEPGALD